MLRYMVNVIGLGPIKNENYKQAFFVLQMRISKDKFGY